jgi:flagellar L-ring protein precursor FlgH
MFKIVSLGILLSASGCATTSARGAAVPALEYANTVRGSEDFVSDSKLPSNYLPSHVRAFDREITHQELEDYRAKLLPKAAEATLLSESSSLRGSVEENGYIVYHSQMPDIRDYRSPLPLGNPGVSSSLWRESGANTDIFRDHRAFRPMDMVTIIISERTEGSNEADTEVKGSSSLLTSIQKFLGFEADAVKKHPALDPSALIQASASNNFKGEGDTIRRGSLRGTISAMVVETLPSGVLRIEGQKIVGVNQEEQVMVISGLVRPRDINSLNEVDSSRIANMRVDYFGKGIVAEAQYGGWLSRFIRTVWPF